MAANTTKRRELVIGGTLYKMPQKMSTLAYINYLDVRDKIMETEEKQALYTKQQFLEMVDAIVEIYGNQFTAEDVLDAEGGLAPDQIVMEFTLIELAVGQGINDRVEKFKKNFTTGK